jgi:hypothetical protein
MEQDEEMRMKDVFQALNHYTRSRRARVLLIVSVCLLAVYFMTPVSLNKAAECLIREDRLVKSDVIVALAGDIRCNREKRAAELWRQGWADKVVVSGMS